MPRMNTGSRISPTPPIPEPSQPYFIRPEFVEQQGNFEIHKGGYMYAPCNAYILYDENNKYVADFISKRKARKAAQILSA